ncbi:MAG: hypothetical protein U0324_46985 [Polyangiales bacterium]
MARRSDDERDDGGLSAFARAMQQRGRPHRVIDFPGAPGVRVAVLCPTEGEIVEADVEARKYLTKELGLTALELSLAQEQELFKRVFELELLATVLRDPDDPEEAFVESADELREPPHGIDRTQRRQLMEAVEDFRRERFERRTPEEGAQILGFLRDLRKGGALSTWWTSCGEDTQLSTLIAVLDSAPGNPTQRPSSDT